MEVEILRTDKTPLRPSEDYRGRAVFQRPGLASIQIDRVQPIAGSENVAVPYERVVWGGIDFRQYRYESKEVVIHPVAAEDLVQARKKSPVHFLFDQSKAELKARFEMKILKQSADGVVISLVPKLKSDLNAFSKAFLLLNQTTYVPEKAMLIAPDGKGSKVFRFQRIRRNEGVDASTFVADKLPEGWSGQRSPW